MEGSLLERKGKVNNILEETINCTYLIRMEMGLATILWTQTLGLLQIKGGHEPVMSFLVQAGVLRESTSSNHVSDSALRKVL